ncbi:RNA recognition motif domain-containing protein [Ditylenchus destructor]|nr:RNA recognition motif domain-containing protein [Ditylenchus destructor]
MSSLRNILQRCARNASILGGTPLQIQCTFNPVYSDPSWWEITFAHSYPTSISRQAYSSDANEAPKNMDNPVQKYILEMINSNKSPPNIAEDQKAPESFKAGSPKKTPFGQIDSIKSPPNVTEDQKTAKSPIFKKNLNLKKYYISVNGLSKETTHESLREFYSQFGEIAFCYVMFRGERNQFGSVAFTSWEAMNRALNSLPHCIDGTETTYVQLAPVGKKNLTLILTNLSPNTTKESLEKFYSNFGWLNGCWIKEENTAIGKVGEVTFLNQKPMHQALDAQPHVIDGSEVFLQYATYDLDYRIEDVPESISEEDLIAFYSKYGQLRECRLHRKSNGMRHVFVSYSAIDEFNRAMADRPHIIDGKPMKIKLLGRGRSAPVSLFVGSLPENVTEETLRNEFSKYGKPVFWELKHGVNYSGPFGIVTYGSEEEALKALNSGPHTIEGAVVDVRKASEVRPSAKEKPYREYRRFR